jgi:glycosyltransferase AglD
MYNEKTIIQDSVELIRTSFDTLGYSYELLLCDDHSIDGTLGEAGSVSSKTVSYLRFSKRLGKGATIKNASRVCSGDAVIMIDADAPITLREFAKGIALLDSGYKFIVGVRRSRPNLRVNRRILSLGFNKLVNLLFKTRIMDHQCGFKIVDRSVAKKLFSLVRSDNFLFDAELIVNARLLKLPVGVLELDWPESRENGDSRISSPRTILTMLMELLLLRLSLFRSNRLIQLKQSYLGYFKIFQTGTIVPAEVTRIVTDHTIIQKILRRLYLCVAFKS